MPDNNHNEDDKINIKQISIFITIPFVIAIPPIIGWFIGNFLDKWLHTEPFLTYFMILCGIIAGIRELYRILIKYGS